MFSFSNSAVVFWKLVNKKIVLVISIKEILPKKRVVNLKIVPLFDLFDCHSHLPSDNDLCFFVNYIFHHIIVNYSAMNKKGASRTINDLFLFVFLKFFGCSFFEIAHIVGS